ncbi:tail protein X [Thiotrichales bacterium 19S11-10]|nr:tail protein X [Thiotrichales bacterium 19S11-10]MCF6808521.1 tail protein X [Thiotrichales bacterium 19S9-11]MCF6812491.1 tail protein X [Thiotrichales bacterium 19S9-12]
MAVYKTKAGDMLDQICYEYYQNEQMFVQVLNANPNLSQSGLILEANQNIYLPDIETPSQIPLKLW